MTLQFRENLGLDLQRSHKKLGRPILEHSYSLIDSLDKSVSSRLSENIMSPSIRRMVTEGDRDSDLWLPHACALSSLEFLWV